MTLCSLIIQKERLTMPRKPKATGCANSPMKCSQTTFPSEHEEQVGFVNWFRAKFPGVLIYAIPNGGHRAVSVGKSLKAEGVTPGVPDLHIPAWGLWVEMKRVKGGKLSDDQMGMIGHLEGIGQKVIVGRGARDASEQVLRFRGIYPGQR